MQREVATTDGWMVAMLRIYCEFIAMLHHPVGPVAGTGGWLSIYYSIMQQQWNERSRGWVFVLGAPAAGVKSHLITWSLSWSCFYCLANTTNNQHIHITHKQLLSQEGLALLSLCSHMDKILSTVLNLTFTSLFHDIVSFIGATKAWAWLQWALHDTRDPGTGQRRESVQQLSSLTIKYNHQTRKSIPKICSCYNPK